jgi:hypothetical protein
MVRGVNHSGVLYQLDASFDGSRAPWSMIVNGTGRSSVAGVAISARGNPIVAQALGVGAELQMWQQLPTAIIQARQPSVLLQELDADGSPLWTKTITSELGFYPPFVDLQTDASGNIFIAGLCSGAFGHSAEDLSCSPDGGCTARFGVGDYALNCRSDGTSTYVAKLSPTGAPIWTTVVDDRVNPGYDGVPIWASSFSSAIPEIAVDSAGNIVATLRRDETTTGDGAVGGLYGTIVVIGLDGSSGDMRWSRRIENRGSDLDLVYLSGYRTTQVDPSGNVIIAGTFVGRLEFGDSTLAGDDTLGMYLVKLAPPTTANP